MALLGAATALGRIGMPTSSVVRLMCMHMYRQGLNMKYVRRALAWNSLRTTAIPWND